MQDGWHTHLRSFKGSDLSWGTPTECWKRAPSGPDAETEAYIYINPTAVTHTRLTLLPRACGTVFLWFQTFIGRLSELFYMSLWLVNAAKSETVLEGKNKDEQEL